MKKIAVAVLILACSEVFGAVLGSPAQSQDLIMYEARAKSAGKMFYDFDKMLSSLKTPVPYRNIVFKRCGVVNAYYEQQTKDINVCFESDTTGKAGGLGW